MIVVNKRPDVVKEKVNEAVSRRECETGGPQTWRTKTRGQNRHYELCSRATLGPDQRLVRILHASEHVPRETGSRHTKMLHAATLSLCPQLRTPRFLWDLV